MAVMQDMVKPIYMRKKSCGGPMAVSFTEKATNDSSFFIRLWSRLRASDLNHMNIAVGTKYVQFPRT
ncbi:hypothetical protein D3C75_1343100 [compost metagenome]